MKSKVDRRQILKIAAALVLANGLSAGLVHADEVVGKPESGEFKLGSTPWLGAGLWEVADKNDLYTRQGLEAVNIAYFSLDSDMNAALAAGQLDAGVLATQTALNFLAAGLPIKIVALLDASTTADAIVSDGSVKTISDLKGKKVAYEEGSTSEILLSFALSRHGMTLADVEKVPMPAADAGAALVAGQVPVAVTYEPYLTVAAQQNSAVQTLFTAGENPGLISDVLVVRNEVIAERPGQIAAMIKAWDAAYKLYHADTKASRAIIAKAEGVEPEELETAFDGVIYYFCRRQQGTARR